jgi:hypothetical protein
MLTQQLQAMKLQTQVFLNKQQANLIDKGLHSKWLNFKFGAVIFDKTTLKKIIF